MEQNIYLEQNLNYKNSKILSKEVRFICLQLIN